MMHWRGIIITSLLIITLRIIELHTHHTKLNINGTKSWLTIPEFENALPLSLNVSSCTNVYINGKFTCVIIYRIDQHNNFITLQFL